MNRQTIGSVLRLAVMGGLVCIAAACGGGGGGEPPTSQGLRNANPLTIAGSVGDGPVTGASIAVLDANGDSVVAGVSNDLAGYEITVPVGTLFPITVKASGGTDLVSGVAPEFDLKAVLLDPTITLVNVSPMSTLALEIARCANDVNPSGLGNAWSLLESRLSMGLDPTRVPDPTNGRIDASNVADIVFANEALGEALRRTESALAGTSAAADGATILSRLGCDLADGAIDGANGNADVRTAATFAAASAGVMMEVVGGTLRVNGANAMDAMDHAIRTIIPGIDPTVTTLNVPVSDQLIDQARDGLTSLMAVLPDDALLKYAVLLEGPTSSNVRAVVNAAMTNGDSATLDGLAARVAASDDTQVTTIAGAARDQVAATPPVVSFAAAPSNVAAGQTTRLSWSTTDALRCDASGAWSGEQPTEGTFVSGALTTSQTYVLSCVGLGGTTSIQQAVQVDASTPPATPPAAPVTSLTVSPASIAAGGTATLAWSSSNADSCVASGGWAGAKATSGNQTVGPLTANSSFAIKCTGAGGSKSATATVIVQQPAAAPTLSFAASPLSVASGASSTLTWSSANATSCVASGAWAGTKAVSGSASTGALTAGKTYTLACTGAGGTVTRSTSVAIAAAGAPTLTFAASPASVKSGSASQLTWSTTNATSCSASGSWSGTKSTAGTQSTGALTAGASYTMACSGAGGSVSQTTTVGIIPAPTLSFTAVPGTVQAGATTQLTWSANGATSCTASGSWTGTKGASGTQSSGALSANASFTLTCTGAGGSVAQTAAVTVSPAPTLTLTATPTSVQSGGTSQLTWTTTNATACTASGSWTGSKAISGSSATAALTSNANYALTCTGNGGSVTKTASVSVVAVPTLTFTASPTSVQSGSSSQLAWSATNATSCTASGGWTGSKGTSGSQSTGALSANASFTLTCSGAGGSASQTASVAVTAASAPTLTLGASPSSVPSGSSSQLSWAATSATSCTASGSWSGAKTTSGTQSTGALTSASSYTLTCTGSGGTVARTTSVAVSALAPTLTLSASPSSVQSGGSSQLTWSTANATSCAASGAWSGSKGTSGTQSTGALTNNSSFTLTCAGAGGNVAQTASVTVTAGTPAVSLSANPPGVARNGTTSLTWSGTNVTTCNATGDWSGSKATTGTESVGPLTRDSTYSLTCSGTGGNAVAMTTVSLREAVLSWQAPTKNVDGSTLTNLSGYKIYYGTTSRNYTQSASVSGASTTQWTLSLAPGTYYFALTAIDAAGGESSKTNEVSKTVR